MRIRGAQPLFRKKLIFIQKNCKFHNEEGAKNPGLPWLFPNLKKFSEFCGFFEIGPNMLDFSKAHR